MSEENRKCLREIGVFALPATAERLLLVVVGMISTIFVGRLGTYELAAVSVSTTILDILMALYSGLGLGATIHIARAAAQEDSAEQVRRISFHAFVIGVVLALVLGGGCIFFADRLLMALFGNLSAETKLLAIRYLKLCLTVSPFLALDIMLSSCLRGVRDARTPFVFTALVNAVNIVLCLLFIYGLGMGIDGAAWAYMISTVIGCAAKLAVVLSGRGKLTVRRAYAFDWSLAGRIMKVSLPSMIEQLLVKTAFLGMQMVTSLIGDVALAGYQVANNLLKLIYAITGGLEAADVTLTGNALGRHTPREARRYAHAILWVGEAATGLCAVLLFVFARACAAIFTKDPLVIDSARHILRIMCFTIPLTTCFQCTQGALKTGGQNALVVLFNVVGPWLIRIPLSFAAIKYWNMGIYGLLLGFFCDYVFRTACYLTCFLREKWLYRLM